MSKKKNNKILVNLILWGFLIGILFLAVAIFVELSIENLKFSLSNIATIHKNNKILIIADFLPLVTVIISYIIGFILSKNFEYTKEFVIEEKKKSTKLIEFAKKLRDGDINAEYEVLNEKDILGKTLLKLRNNLKETEEEEEERKKIDEQQNWITVGLAKFGEILRSNNDNMEKLSFEVISNLGKYINAIQGGFYILNDSNDSKYFELTAHFAYDRKKYSNKEIQWGEGLIGRAALEKKSIYIDKVPEDYVNVTSGLGDGNPQVILIVPLLINEEAHGVIEFASFNKFQKHEIEFIEKIAESIASTISNMKINIRTAKLLGDSQEQAEKLAIQEEEMRQTMEELQATQAEAAKQSEEFISFTNSVNHTLIRAEYNTNGILLYANTKFIDKLEYSKTSEVKGQHISAFLHEDDKDWFNEIWDELSRGGKHFVGYMKHITKTGKKLWTLATYTCIRSKEGIVEKILFLAIENTKQKRISIDYEGQNKAIDLTLIKGTYDPNGILIDCNDNYEKTLEYGKNDLNNISIFDLIIDSERDSFKAIWENINNGNPTTNIAKRVSKSGKEIWLQTTYIAIFDLLGEIEKVIAISNNITEKKILEIKSKEQANQIIEQQAKLQKNEINLNIITEETRIKIEEKYKEIEKIKVLNEKTLENTIDAIFTIDNSGKIIFFNKTAETLWEQPQKNVIMRQVRVLFSKDKSKNGEFIKMLIDPESKKSVGIRKKIKITTRNEEEKSVEIFISEAEYHDEHTYTAFVKIINN